MKIKRSVLLSLLVQVTLRWMYKYAKEKIPKKYKTLKTKKMKIKCGALLFWILTLNTMSLYQYCTM